MTRPITNAAQIALAERPTGAYPIVTPRRVPAAPVTATVAAPAGALALPQPAELAVEPESPAAVKRRRSPRMSPAALETAVRKLAAQRTDTPKVGEVMKTFGVGRDKARAAIAALRPAADALEPVSAPPSPVETAPATEPAKPRRVASWPLMLLALPAFVAVWSGWVGLGSLTGFGVVHPLPGIWDGFRLNTAITLPIGVEAYAAYALRAWLSGPPRARRFARASSIGALVLGALGQVAYHVMVAAGIHHAPAYVTVPVACLPVIVLGMGAALTHLLRSE
jgi:hypothetical protein